MPKVKGTNSTYVAVNNFNKTFPAFLKWIEQYHSKALEVLASYLENEDASENLRFSSAKQINEMALRFYKEFKNATPKDFDHLSIRSTPKAKATGNKKEGNGLIKLTYDETGTED